MRILVTGATGFIGGAVAQAALDAGHDVRAFARREWVGQPRIAAEHRSFGELPFQLDRDLMSGVDALVHCAAVADPSQARSHAINVLGTSALAAVAQAAGVGTLVFLSSQSARPDAPAAYGRTKYAAEEALRGFSDMSVVVLRPGLVCGAGGLFGRMVRTVSRLPAVPMVAPDALVQPIWVQDLVAAIFHSIEHSTALAGSILELGLDPGVSLGAFMHLVANGLSQERKPIFPVPLTPLYVAAAIAERFAIDLPLKTSSLAAMRNVRAMSTSSDMKRLGLAHRDARQIVQLALADMQQPRDTATTVPGVTRTLLVGGGRIGLVHAVSLSRLPGLVLAGVADKSPQARGLLRSMGLKTSYFDSLEVALDAGQVEAAVIATPPASHLALAQACTQRGLATLVEKPAATTDRQLATFAEIATSDARVLVGYLMLRLPHVGQWLEKLKKGELGEIHGFEAFTLLSLITSADPKRWEARPEVSGGGVLANSAGHILSLVVEAFGSPVSMAVETSRTFSTRVEDAAVISFDYGRFSGALFACWTIPGFPRQENRLVVHTERGNLTLTPSMAVFASAAGIQISHALDEPTGFNLAPDYGGGGIARELQDLRAGMAPTRAVTLDRALAVERLSFSAYALAKEVKQFHPPLNGRDLRGATFSSESPSLPVASQRSRRVADLRDVPASLWHQAGASLTHDWAEAVVYPAELSEAARLFGGAQVRITVPDFLGQTRLLSDKNYAALARQFGPRGLLSGGLAAAQAFTRERSVGFWVAAQALLAGDLARVPSSFGGTLVLHPYLTDLALALGATDRLENLVRIMRRTHRRATLGLQSNLGTELVNVVVTMDEPPALLSVLASPAGGLLTTLRTYLEAAAGTHGVRLTAEVGPGPLAAHRLAYREPLRWTGGEDSIVISSYASPDIFAAAVTSLDGRWSQAFPGTFVPPTVW